MFKGLPFIGKMNEFLDRALHATVQKVGPSRAAIDVIGRGYYMLNPVPTVAYVVEAGSTDEIVVLTGHPVKPGDLIRLKTTANNINEFEIIVHEVIDANSFKLAGYLSANLTAGDTFDILRPITERFDSTGATLATVASPPLSYNRKAAGVTTQTDVLEDLDTPTNSRALPVVIHSIDGAPIVVNAGDLSVSTSHVNDSMALGDGTNLVGVTANNELKTKDTDVETQLTTLNAVDFATEAKQDTQITHLSEIEGAVETIESTIVADGAAQPTNGMIVGGHDGVGNFRHIRVTNAGVVKVEQDAQPLPTGAATETTLNGLLTAFNAEDFATAANQSTMIGHLSSIAAEDFATAANQATANGHLASIAAEDFATEATLAAMSAKLPATLGSLPMAQSLSVTMASNQAAIPVALVDSLESKPRHIIVHDSSFVNIPQATDLPVQIVASTSVQITSVKWSDEIGEIIGLYTGAAAAEVLVAVFAFGGDTIPVDIPAGTRVSIRNMKDVDITSGFATIQLIG